MIEIIKEDNRILLAHKLYGYRFLLDWTTDKAAYRYLNANRNNELLLKAINHKAGQPCFVLDLTCGLGKDAFLMASQNMRVIGVEQNELIFKMLLQAKHIAQNNNDFFKKSSLNLEIIHAESIYIMQNWQQERPNIIYLDPMFPKKIKSSLVKKDMVLMQELLKDANQTCENLLLSEALKLTAKKVIVKRPRISQYLDNKKPSYQVLGKSNRFDVYLPV